MINIIPVLTSGKMTNAIKVGIVTVVLVLIWLTYSNNSDVQKNFDLEPKMANITINNSLIKAEVSDTESLMARGLSGRKSLGDKEGMWFVFDSDGQWGFWMKEMNFPIDIIWFDQNLKIVYFQKNILPKSYPKIFYPDNNARYVLEVNAGFIEKTKIKIGDDAEVILK